MLSVNIPLVPSTIAEYAYCQHSIGSINDRIGSLAGISDRIDVEIQPCRLSLEFYMYANINTKWESTLSEVNVCVPRHVLV